MSHGNGRRILNNEQYLKSADWLLKKAYEIEDPLIDQINKEKLKNQFDFVAEKMEEYSRGRMVKMFPNMRQLYESTNQKFVEPDDIQDSDVLTREQILEDAGLTPAEVKKHCEHKRRAGIDASGDAQKQANIVGNYAPSTKPSGTDNNSQNNQSKPQNKPTVNVSAWLDDD